MDFIKYEHIENFTPQLRSVCDYREWHPEPETTEWVATEKIDGANFQFVVTSDAVVCCSRNRVLDSQSGSFHNFQKLAKKYDESVKAVFRWCCEKESCDEEMLVVRIYGEIFGGMYPGVNWDWTPMPSSTAGAGCASITASGDGGTYVHDNMRASIANISAANVNTIRVKPNANGGIQKRIFYIPDVDYYLFDISYARLDEARVVNDDGGSSPCYLDIDELLPLASQCGFTYVAQPIHRGTFDELCQLPREFHTTIPALAGLPELAGSNAEGYVLRPLRSVDKRRPFRLKLKSEAFAEFTNPSGKHPNPATNKPRNSPKVTLSEREQAMSSHLMSGVNANRLAGVVSKLERNVLYRMDDRYVAALLIEDALEEIATDRPDLRELFGDLSKATLKKIKASVFQEAVAVVAKARPGF